MNRRKQLITLKMLCSFLIGIIVTMFVNTNSVPNNMSTTGIAQSNYEKGMKSITEYAEVMEAKAQILAGNEATKHVAAVTEAIQVKTEIVNTKTKSTIVAKILHFRSKASTILDEIIAIEPRYNMSYYNDLLDTDHIEELVTKQVHHIGVALMKDRRICYVNNFIKEAHMDDVVWRYVKGMYSTGSSP